jgi:hypothetical protein
MMGLSLRPIRSFVVRFVATHAAPLTKRNRAPSGTPGLGEDAMDAIRFDALARLLAASGPRRLVLAVAATGLFGQEAAAGCKKVGKKCDKSKDCCDGAKCKGGKCRCKSGWTTCNGEKLCRNLASDPVNCGACGQTCAAGCCAGGVCRPLCGDACCADCFAEATAPKPKGKPIPNTEACCAASSVCNNGTGDPADDLCCWPDEVCIDGHCCCDGCQGSVVCGGTCCPSVSCCQGNCCGPDQVCARTQPNKPKTCVSAFRSCTTSADCYEEEVCHGGACCSGDRICSQDSPPVSVCCPVGEHCDPDDGSCCDNNVTCGTTGKKVRIRAG